jgi:hypothetical protein
MIAPMTARLSLPGLGLALLLAPAAAGAQARGGNCVAIGTPKPALEYVYRLTDSRGTSSDFRTVWDEITRTQSRSRTTRGRGGDVESISRYRIVDDVSVIDETSQSDAGTTTFAPGVVGDPFGRACAGGSWPIAAATATNRSARGTFSAKSDAGELKMLGLHVSATVPAGTFDTVHYTRTTTSARGTVVDEYWKSIEHGVVVRHRSAVAGVTLTEELQAIR